jgi:hypothetical protein
MYIPWVIIAIGIVIVWWMVEKRNVLIERRFTFASSLHSAHSRLRRVLGGRPAERIERSDVNPHLSRDLPP